MGNARKGGWGQLCGWEDLKTRLKSQALFDAQPPKDFLEQFYWGCIEIQYTTHFKVYGLISFGMCIHPWNYQHNQDNAHIQSSSEVPLKDFKRLEIKTMLWENVLDFLKRNALFW